MPNLHIERFGHGIPMVFLHGWGMQRSLLRAFAQEFAARYSIWLVDMPGYGHSDFLEKADDTQVLTRYLVQQLAIDGTYILVGWSLGAMVALQMAMSFPQRIARLILFTATPCFMATPNWPYGVAQAALQQVSDELSQNYTQAMNRFLQLQLKNLPGARDTLRAIKAVLAKEPVPQHAALQQGLQLLATIDLRPQLESVAMPTLIINGDRDSLIPSPAARVLAEQLSRAQAVIVHGAGHVPFITHASVCRQYVQEFLTC